MTNKNIKSAFLALAITPALAFAQADMPPTNDLVNPYSTQSGYFKMPAGRDWGSSSTVEIDADGESIWVAERCGGNVNFCVERPDTNLIMLFSKNGDMVRSFGAGYLTWPHGIHVDHDGNVWVADARGIRIGSAITGEVELLIPDPQPDCRGTCTAEGVVADAHGNIFGAEVGPVGGIKRYVRPIK